MKLWWQIWKLWSRAAYLQWLVLRIISRMRAPYQIKILFRGLKNLCMQCRERLIRQCWLQIHLVMANWNYGSVNMSKFIHKFRHFPICRWTLRFLMEKVHPPEIVKEQPEIPPAQQLSRKRIQKRIRLAPLRIQVQLIHIPIRWQTRNRMERRIQEG